MCLNGGRDFNLLCAINILRLVMDEYIVGSVADFISNKSRSNVKTKKKKSAVNDKGLTIEESCEPHKEPSNVLKVKNKKKKKVELQEFSDEYFPKNQENVKTSSSMKNTKNMTPPVNSKSESKKRKKLDKTDHGVSKKKKFKTDSLDLDFVPSDSDNKEDEDVKNHSEIKQSVSKDAENKCSNENTVFIGNLPIKFDKQKICKAFSKFGEIQNARIRCVPIADINMSKKVAAIKKTFNPKRNSLVAYVNFKSLDSAKAAVDANGMVIDGHHLRIDFANESKERDNNKAVFVGGLAFDIEDDELWEFFEKCGKINSVRVVRDSQTSMGKGFGYVNFDSSTSVELALQMDGQELKKRTINVKRCVNARNKNKSNSFGKKKSKEMANELLCKKGKKFKEEKKKLKKENKFSVGFQGRTANMKQKKKKKLSKAALKQRKLVKILGAS